MTKYKRMEKKRLGNGKGRKLHKKENIPNLVTKK
jgi:hypothetical protein